MLDAESETKIKSLIIQLSNLLDKNYELNFNFRNHCYLRIAYDNAVGNKWDIEVVKPFTKNANIEQLRTALNFLESYLSNTELLLSHNKISLGFRTKIKNSK